MKYVDELILKLISSGVEPNKAIEGFNLAVEDLKNNKMSDNIAKLFNGVKIKDHLMMVFLYYVI